VIDAHVHLWDAAAVAPPLLADRPELGARRDAAALREAVWGHGVRAVVAVETASVGTDSDAELRWLCEQAGDGLVRGIVAWAPIDRADVGSALDRIVASTAPVVGVRRSFEFEPDGFAAGPDAIAGVREVGARGLPFDLVLFARSLPACATLAEACPDTHLVLDHLGKPPAGDAPGWEAALRTLAACPTVVCKLSGLTPDAGAATDWGLIRARLETAVDCFGWDRVLFASDWPICTSGDRYAAWLRAVAAVASEATESQRRALFGDNAARVYGLGAERSTDGS
jgi:L-fuconolactonase